VFINNALIRQSMWSKNEPRVIDMTEPKPEMPRRVFLLLQNRLLRDALGRLLSRRQDLLIVGCRKPEACTSQMLVEVECDVLVLDFLEKKWLPTTLCQERGDVCRLKVLLICMTDESEQFLAAVRGGATGYLLNDASAADVISAVRATAKGEAICPPKLCALLFDSLSNSVDDGPVAHRPVLTLRQQQLVALMANGLTNKQIASRLCLSEFTVKNHVHRIMKHCKAESRSQAVGIIHSHGYRLDCASTNTNSALEILNIGPE
jgi:two-component system response regulator DevR